MWIFVKTQMMQFRMGILQQNQISKNHFGTSSHPNYQKSSKIIKRISRASKIHHVWILVFGLCNSPRHFISIMIPVIHLVKLQKVKCSLFFTNKFIHEVRKSPKNINFRDRTFVKDFSALLINPTQSPTAILRI